MAIPKIIHYCWFGRGKKSQLILDCMESWKKYLPDYEIIEWNEDNFDIGSNMYVKEAYETKKWAFVSDYVRLYALYKMGGIYLDTDVEVIKSLDAFLNNSAFFGLESNDSVSAGIIGCVPHHPVIQKIIDSYDGRQFIGSDGSMDLSTNVSHITKMFGDSGFIPDGKLQHVMNVTLYPARFFFPNTFMMIFGRLPRAVYIDHHSAASWKDTVADTGLKYRIRHYLVGVARNLIGTVELESIRDRKRSDV